MQSRSKEEDMGMLELDLDISKEARAMQKEVREFAIKQLRPVGIELDRMANPADVIAPSSPLWEAFKAYRKLGLHATSLPKELGGMSGDLDPKAKFLIAQEMGYGDAGLSVSFGSSSFPFRLASMSPDPELQQLVRDYVEDTECKLVGCWAITEPMHGSDWILGINPKFDDPRCGPELQAELKGDEYILNGQKSAWVTNGTIATHAALHVGLDPKKGMQGNGLAILPLDLPGISRGKALDKMGQRPLNQGELIFNNVKIPRKYMIIEDSKMMTAVVKSILITANSSMGLTFIGLAQAAYDEALNYAKNRIQGGVPIFEHKNIKLMLFDMFMKIEAARAFVRRNYMHVSATSSGSPPHAVAAKVLGTRTSFEVASDAITIFGGNGLAREYVIEKLFRDARASMVEDGENNALSLTAAEELV